jgi:predicted enzyme related to lactoylglutathione lyase
MARFAQGDYNGAMQITGSDPVLAVHDLEGSADWFCGVLGCERSDPDPGNWVFCRAGAVTFMLGRCPDALPAAELGDHSYVAYLTVDSVDAYYAQAMAAGADVLKRPTDEPWRRREMGLRSPEGHRFMLGENI